MCPALVQRRKTRSAEPLFFPVFHAGQPVQHLSFDVTICPLLVISGPMTTRRLTLNDLPLRRLVRMLRDTVRLVGPNDQSPKILRRAVETKRAATRRRTTHASCYQVGRQHEDVTRTGRRGGP